MLPAQLSNSQQKNRILKIWIKSSTKDGVKLWTAWSVSAQKPEVLFFKLYTVCELLYIKWLHLFLFPVSHKSIQVCETVVCLSIL